MRALALTFNLIAGCLCILLSAIPIILFLFFGLLELLNAGGEKSVLLEAFVISLIGLVAAVITFVFAVINFRSLRPGRKTGHVIPFQIIILVVNVIQYIGFYVYFYVLLGMDNPAFGRTVVAGCSFFSVLTFIFAIIAYINHQKRFGANNNLA